MLFSIVTVCFNSSQTLARTIDSILGQCFKDYEYIIVDGGSTDGTLDIIRSYESRFEGRLSWISEKDNGIYDAFNKGVKMAAGEYVWIVNSDDYLTPDALENLAAVISEYPDHPIISAAAYSRNAKEEIIGEIYYDESMLPGLMEEDSLAFVHPATLISRQTYSRIGLYDERYVIAGDLDLSRRAWLAEEKIIYPRIFITNMSTGGISDGLNLKTNIRDRRLYFSKFYPQGSSRRFYRWLRFYIQGWVKKIVLRTLHISK